MTIFRCSVLVAALFASTSSTQAASAPESELFLAAKAAIGRLEIRQRNTPGPGQTTIIKAERLLELPFGQVFVTTVTIDQGGHAEVGALGIYYLKRIHGRFVLQRKWPKAVEGGGFGYAPDWNLSTRFTKFPAIYATAGWGSQGYTCGWSILTELTPGGPVVSDTIFSSKSNRGVGFGKVDEANGRIVNIKRESSFEVRATGTSRFVEHYFFRHGRFVRLEQESRLQC